LKYFFTFLHQIHILSRKYNKNHELLKWRNVSFCVFFLFITFIGFAQNSESDSLQNIITKGKDDSLKVNALITLAQTTRETEPQKAFDYASKAKDLASAIGYKKGVGYSYKWMGIINYNQGKYFDALDDFNKSLSVFESIKDEVGISNLLNNLGALYSDKDEDSKSLEYYLKSLNIAQKSGNKLRIATALSNIGVVYFKDSSKIDKALEYYLKALPIFVELKDSESIGTINTNIGEVYLLNNAFTKALYYFYAAETAYKGSSSVAYTYNDFGKLYKQKKVFDSAIIYYQKANKIATDNNSPLDIAQSFFGMAEVDMAKGEVINAISAYKKALQIVQEQESTEDMKTAYNGLSVAYQKAGNYKSAYSFQSLLTELYNTENKKKLNFNTATFEYSMEIQKQSIQIDLLVKEKALQKLDLEKANFAKNTAIAAIAALLIFAVVLLRNNNHKKQLNKLLYKQKEEIETQKLSVEAALLELKETQAQLIQSEKMASLGDLTAGIAHEIQNPLNFVNNFSEVSNELIAEMKTELTNGNVKEAIAIADYLIVNLGKISHHGKRADAIVKGMLQHSRTSSGQKEMTNINNFTDEYFRIAYQSFKAKEKSFNAVIKTDYDENVGNLNITPQEIGMVLLNLYNNAFYIVFKKKKELGEGYEPTVSVSTKKTNDKVEIRVKDNGNGIPKKVFDKIFQPFFTTKPSGQGTGLGLSLSYDIIKAHGGEIKVESTEGEGAEFIIQFPLKDVA
jgi:two-component system NtrC family sensor kinase